VNIRRLTLTSNAGNSIEGGLIALGALLGPEIADMENGVVKSLLMGLLIFSYVAVKFLTSGSGLSKTDGDTIKKAIKHYATEDELPNDIKELIRHQQEQ